MNAAVYGSGTVGNYAEVIDVGLANRKYRQQGNLLYLSIRWNTNKNLTEFKNFKRIRLCARNQKMFGFARLLREAPQPMKRRTESEATNPKFMIHLIIKALRYDARCDSKISK